MVGETTAAEDLVQECFIKMWEKKLWKRVNKSLESFLFIMIHNRCLDYVKSEQTQLKRKRRYFINAEQENHSWENPVDERQQRETQLQQWNDFQVTFQQLPPQQQNAFRMFYYDRKSHAEGAKLIGISLNTFRTHLKRAVKKLLHSS
ncbi:RNA polymerase sigma factor [Chitinophaga pinensis]|uniref:RNA polymerase sigma factor n=1 Tax=Chitinophaga pinensis TaxID=79329 RepID=UPI0034DF8084